MVHGAAAATTSAATTRTRLDADGTWQTKHLQSDRIVQMSLLNIIKTHKRRNENENNNRKRYRLITDLVLLPDRCFLLLDSPSPAAGAARLANWAVVGIPGMAIDASGLPKNGYDIAMEERDESDESLADVIEPDARRDVGSVVDAVVARRCRC